MSAYTIKKDTGIFCNYCGSDLDDDYEVCPYCGSGEIANTFGVDEAVELSVPTSRITFQQQLDILIYAVYATKPFRNADIRNHVVDLAQRTITRLLVGFVKSGYLEKVSFTRYKATPYAKELMGVKQI